MTNPTTPTTSNNLRLDLSRVALKRRRTKIVATIGPSSSSDEMVERLIVAGVDVFRLNFSHGTHPTHAENIARIRKISERLGVNVAILGDLCGPKIRVGMFTGGGVELAAGAKITVTTREIEGHGDVVQSQYDDLAKDVNPGDRVLLDDGKLELRVLFTDKKTEVQCEVVHGGWLSNKKGMNLPGVKVSAPALTAKDKEDATFAVKEGVDFLALSFVRTPADVEQLKAVLRDLGKADTPIVAKIEKPEAIQHIDAIMDVVDAIMIARGDLGVEMPAEEVPLLQSELIRIAIEKNRPVIVATQMLESMIESARPTRAEVTDVAAAALARTDAVMLSAETAAGKNPVAAVATMDRILRLVEGYQYLHGQHGRVRDVEHGKNAADPSEALSRATSLLSADLGVRAIVVPTRSGRTARLVSAERPAAPVLALTHELSLCRRLALSWGLMPELVSAHAVQSDPRKAAMESVRKCGLADAGDTVLLVWDAGGKDHVEPTVSIVTV